LSPEWRSHERKFKQAWLKKIILSTFVMVIKPYNVQLLRVTSIQTWKITSMWKFSLCEHLSPPHWLMSEPKFYPQVQILHKCVVSSLWVELTNN
jgi:hypothetical protein